jgi:sugar (pentulose or hexulose) kinase
LEERGVKPNMLCGHGGYFKTEKIGAKAMAAALDTPITVLKNAGEGGAWGIATLALYLDNTDKSLDDFLDGIFANQPKSVEYPDEQEKQTFKHYIENYKATLPVEFAAIKK